MGNDRSVSPQRVERDWIVAPLHPERERLSRELGVPPVVAQVLLNRGLSASEDVRSFLEPDFRSLHPPESLPNAAEVGRRMAEAARAGRRIVIYGDYDVDGVTATAILWHALRRAGAQVSYYIPSRMEEGYGLNAEALERLAADGAQLVVTVDCGVTAVREAKRARELGVELIITDHHEPRDELPDAVAIVHPTALGPSPNPHLSGAGVALKVAWALCRELAGGGRVNGELRDDLLDATGLAALGLVADVVPLMGENRIIASYGLRQLCHTRNPGLRALIEVSGLTGKASYDDYDVGFMLAPRLNAVGRMGHAREAVELFTSAPQQRAEEIARNLDAQNRRRQSVERGMVAQAEEMVIERGMHLDGCRGIVLARSDWHAGVIGIVASRLVDRFRRPTILIAVENGLGQGSGRSIRHFPLHEVLACCQTHLVSFGGHAMAAGVKVRAEHIDAFTAAFQEQAAQRLTLADLRHTLSIDDEIGLEALRLETVEPLLRMAPFGIGNPRPVLATGEVELAEAPRVVGQSSTHLQLTLRQGGTHRRGVAFGKARFAAELSEHRRMRVAFEPMLNEWGGQRRVEMKVIDWKYTAPTRS